MFIPQEELEAGHLGIEWCNMGAERNHHCIGSAAAQEAVWREFRAQDHWLDMVETFK